MVGMAIGLLCGAGWARRACRGILARVGNAAKKGGGMKAESWG